MVINYTRFAELVVVKALMNLRSEASRNLLSYSWWIIEPLMHMTVYYIVFDVLFSRGGENYIVFLLIGITNWLWFVKTVTNASVSIMVGKGLMTQIDINKIFFPLVIVVQDFIKQIPVFCSLIGILFIFDITVSITWLAWPVIIICQLLFTTLIAIIFAALVPFMQDLRFIITSGMQFLMFLSGVFYSQDIIPEQYLDIFFLNPMARLLYCYRQVLLHNTWPDWIMLGELFVVCYLALILVVWLLRKKDHLYPKVV